MLGFTIRVERQGNEYATEAERGVLTGYFEHRGLHQMSDEADVRHLNSIRLLEKNGFQLKERQQAEVGDVDRAAGHAVDALTLAAGMESQRLRDRFEALRQKLLGTGSAAASDAVEQIDASLAVPI